MANRRSNFRRSAGPRRNTEWLAFEVSGSLTSVGPSTKSLIAVMDATEKGKLPFTITRTLGTLFVQSDQQAANEFAAGAFGAYVAEDRAVAVGITAIADPVTEANSDIWFVYKAWQESFKVVGTTGVSDNIYRQDFDSKAQRKVEEGQDIVFVIANAASSPSIQFNVQFRMLIKLH